MKKNKQIKIKAQLKLTTRTKQNTTIYQEIKSKKEDDFDDDDLNSSNSSLELFKPKTKICLDSKKKNYNMYSTIIDQIDLTNATNCKYNSSGVQSTSLTNLNFDNKRNSFNVLEKSLTNCLINNSSDSDGSFKSATSLTTENTNKKFDIGSPINISDESDTENDNLYEKKTAKVEYYKKSFICNSKQLNNSDHENNGFLTPTKTYEQPNDLTESAKVLDRLYGNQWRNINGIIVDAKKKNLNNLLRNFNESFCDNSSNSNQSEFDNSLSCKSPVPFENKKLWNMDKHSNKLSKDCGFQTNNIQQELDDASQSLMNVSLSERSNNLPTDLLTSGENCKSSVIDYIDLSTPVKIHSDNENLKLNKTKKKGVNEKKKKKEECDIVMKISDINDAYSISSDSKLSFLSSLSCFTGSMKCDPEAEKYKLKFKKHRDDLVCILFKLFNKEVFENKLPTDMNFKWNARLRTTAGACFNRRSVKINENLDCIRVSRIELSSKIIDTAERLRDTLIHELCHAACWIFNNVAEGHGPAWKSWANKAMQRFPELPIIKRCHSYAIQTKYTYKCIKCGYSFGRHSKSLNLEKKRCGYCYGEFELIVNKINKNPELNSNLPNIQTDPLKELYNIGKLRKS
ncbi:arrestin domain-containing protein F-like isoform X2 [Adelges cooleyi]|uniref:arrestin domain-containing protein F-like isoform X2 n=1 Tax=Adelges cooleyi TaxID=133065 RepID=UPI00217FE66B|nr:arrestin domain-containing protein F-like isoform X2 [Adelges cooleyi]